MTDHRSAFTEARDAGLVWVYDGHAIDQVLPEFNPDLNMLAGMHPGAIYFYAELVIPRD